MKKFTLLALCAAVLLSASACSGKMPEGDPQAERPKSGGVYEINGFNGTDDLNTLTLNGVLGKAELCEDKTYVKEGKASLRVQVIADPYKEAQPYLYQAMNIEKRGIDCTDFGKAQHVTIEVYNAQSEERRFGMQMVYTDSYNKDVAEWFTLKPSGWTSVKYTIAREYIPEYTLRDGSKIHYVRGLNLVFDRPAEDEIFYLDDMRVYRTDKPFTPVTMSLEKDEICLFDKLWQVRKLGFECYGGSELVPSVSYVKDKTSTGRGAALKIETVPGAGLGRWPGIVLNEEMLALVDWKSYGDNDRLCFDLYAPSIGGLDKIYPNFYCNGMRLVAMDGVSLQRGEWITVSYTVKEINAYSTGATMNFANITGIKFFYLEHSGKSRTMYLDNIRMERDF